MNVGDYIRTKKRALQPPQIARIKSMQKDSGYHNLYYIELDHNLIPYYNFHIYTDDIDKSSPNIIELLEPMDLLYIDISPDDCGGIVVPRIPETLDELKKYIEKIKSGEYILKYVVTHEQLENNMYKVGEK